MSTIIKKNLPFFAIVVLLIGISSTVYVNATESNNTQTISINDQEYSIEQLFTLFNQKTIMTDDGERTGIPLDELLHYSGINSPEHYEYIIKANNYQQTVKWENMQAGVFIQDDVQVVFPNLALAFWVYDVLEIEVNEL